MRTYERRGEDIGEKSRQRWNYFPRVRMVLKTSRPRNRRVPETNI